MSDKGGGEATGRPAERLRTKCAGVSPSSYTKPLEMLSTNLNNIIRIHHND